MLPAAIPPGARLGGYRIVEELGRGGMGVVLKAQDEKLGRLVAIKVLPRDTVSDKKSLDRFMREAQGAAAVAHPNITTIFQFGEANGWPYLVFELMTGGSLHDRLKKQGPFPWRDAAAIGAKVARALGAIHAAGLIHRDLKPANVLLDGAGTPKLSDFGLVRRQQAGNSLTGAGELVGTAAYLAPEQAGDAKVDFRADLYALGATLYALLTGAPPFEGEGLSVITKHLTARPTSLIQRGVEVPKALDPLVLRLLEKKPEARGASADAVAEELEGLLRAPEKPVAPPKPSKTRLVLGGALVVVALIVGGAVLLRKADAPPKPVVTSGSVDVIEPSSSTPIRPESEVVFRLDVTAGSESVFVNGVRAFPKDGLLEAHPRVHAGDTVVTIVAKWPGGAVVRKQHPVTLQPAWTAAADVPGRLPKGLAFSKEPRVYVWQPPAGPPVELVYVPAGEFLMGANDGSTDEEHPEFFINEPAHTRKLAHGFFFGRYELTRGQYLAFCAAGHHSPPPKVTNWPDWTQTDEDPVVMVDWYDARAYVDWAGLRLPREEEWEKAARGPTGEKKFPWGEAFDLHDGKCRANICDASCPATETYKSPLSDGFPFTAPVGSMKEDCSPYGAFDVVGNVAEWCEDWYDPHAYERFTGIWLRGCRGHENDPLPQKRRVVRGSSWYGWSLSSAPQGRGSSHSSPDNKSATIGIRVALSED